MKTPKVKVLTAVPSLKSTQEERDMFDKMFWESVSYHPEELDKHGDKETKLERLVREKREKANVLSGIQGN